MHVLQICCFNRHSNLQSRMNCGPDGAELHRTTLLQCLGGVTAASTSGTASSAERWHCACAAVWSGRLTRQTPSPLDFFYSDYVETKVFTCPWATNSYRIQDCYRQGIAELSTDQCRRTVSLDSSDTRRAAAWRTRPSQPLKFESPSDPDRVSCAAAAGPSGEGRATTTLPAPTPPPPAPTARACSRTDGSPGPRRRDVLQSMYCSSYTWDWTVSVIALEMVTVFEVGYQI